MKKIGRMAPMRYVALAAVMVLAMGGQARAAQPARAVPLIPRAVLLGNPELLSPQLSPDGTRLAWLAPDANAVMQVWIRSIGKDDAQAITKEKGSVRGYLWGEDNRTLAFFQDGGGDENFHLIGVDLVDGNVRDYTPFRGVRLTRMIGTDPGHPDEILVVMNLRDRKSADAYRISWSTGAVTLEAQNPGGVLSWVVDSQFRIRGAQASRPDGGTDILIRASQSAPWQRWLSAAPEEILQLQGFNSDGTAAYLTSSLGRDTAALIERDLVSGKETVLAASDRADAGAPLINPRTHAVEAVSFNGSRSSWNVVDSGVKRDFSGIAGLFDGDFSVIDRTAADDAWLVKFTSDRHPEQFFRWDRSRQKGEFLFNGTPKLEGVTLAEMKPVEFSATDGMKLHGYLTLPLGAKPRGLPMVVVPHGGPWARDSWGYNSVVQWLANRGYAVLQVNFRGSTGYGKTYLNAGNRQWGLKMQTDLIDGIDWVLRRGIADPKRIAFFGWSYGGYATLVAATFTPERFACYAAFAPPSDVKAMMASASPMLRSMNDYRVGRMDDPADDELFRNASPLFKADRIRRPLLIGHGGIDPFVKVTQSDAFVDAIERTHGSVTFVKYPNEGHGMVNPANLDDFFGRAETLLAQCLGGRAEPLPGGKAPGSTAVVRIVGQ